jgi:DNA-binding transcriptional LysR family regulator
MVALADGIYKLNFSMAHLSMSCMNLAGLDLNLLVLLEALLEEENVTRAGARVGLSQPAASHALRRLRGCLDDPLLEKHGRTLRLSKRAHELRAPLAKVLEDLRRVLDAPGDFDPSVTSVRVRLFASDHITFVLLPALLRRLEIEAPAMEVALQWTRGDQAVDLVGAGHVDLAIGRYNNTPQGIRRAGLYDEDLVVLGRRGHPLFVGPLTAESFAAWPRIATSFDGRLFGDQEQAMARAGIPVRSRIVMPHLLAAPMLTLETDLVTVVPRRMAVRLADLVSLDWRPLPFASPPVPLEMIWNERSADPAVAWFRDLVRAVAATI